MTDAQKKSSMFPAFVLLVSKVVLIFGPLGGKPQVFLIFGAVLSLEHVLIFWAGFAVSGAKRSSSRKAEE